MQTPPLLQRSAIGVHQRRKIFEMRNEYTLVDETGQPIGTANQQRQGWMTFLLRLFSDLDVALPMVLEVRDQTGQLQLEVDKPWFTWRTTVKLPDGTTVGSISKKIRLGKARFQLHGPAGEDLGQVHAQNWRARDFVVYDATETQVADVTKEWRGLFTEAFTDADSYAVEFSPTIVEPLRTLSFAAALAVDIVMKQKDAG